MPTFHFFVLVFNPIVLCVKKNSLRLAARELHVLFECEGKVEAAPIHMLQNTGRKKHILHILKDSAIHYNKP